MDPDFKTPTTDRFTRLMIFSSNHGFPSFAHNALISYKAVFGFYEGLIENSYVVNIHDVKSILASGLLLGQDSVLLLTPQEAVFNGKRQAYLTRVCNDGHTLDPNGECLGDWCKVTVGEALLYKAWTCYPDDNDWYVTKMLEV